MENDERPKRQSEKGKLNLAIKEGRKGIGRMLDKGWYNEARHVGHLSALGVGLHVRGKDKPNQYTNTKRTTTLKSENNANVKKLQTKKSGESKNEQASKRASEQASKQASRQNKKLKTVKAKQSTANEPNQLATHN